MAKFNKFKGLEKFIDRFNKIYKNLNNLRKEFFDSKKTFD